MNIAQLCKFRKLPQYEKLIEVCVSGQGRWLFATDGCRAIGVRTNESAGVGQPLDDRYSNAANVISGYFSRTFQKLNTQHFMSWLFSEDTCSTCEGNKKTTCSECNGNGDCECENCDGSGYRQVTCGECDGSGSRRVKCDSCDGDGDIEEDCNECDGTEEIDHECETCHGTRTNDDGEMCEDCKGKGDIRKACEECDGGKVKVTCPDCEGDGHVDEDCEECDCGEVEEECNECNGDGRVECNECDECDENNKEDCDDCKLNLGKIFGTTSLDLKLVKDLGMNMFNEVSVRDARDAVVFRGDGVMAIVMPFYDEQMKCRNYKAE